MVSIRRVALAALLGVAAALPLSAQQPDTASTLPRPMATRPELQAALKDAKNDAQRAIIRDRLEHGDFRPGDRIVLRVLQEPTLNDTFMVRAGQTLLLPNIPEFSLSGVLRSELKGFLTAKIAQYIRNPTVDAVPLVNLAILGAVARPGFYSVPADLQASQVMMIAGGPGGSGDLRKAEVRRGDTVVVSRATMQLAFANGVTVDQLNLHGGDQFYVGEKSGGLRGALQTVGLLAGVFSAIYFATRVL